MNEIYKINSSRLQPIVQIAREKSSVFLAELQGRCIQTLNDYFIESEKAFHFPSPCEGNANRYLDWMTDLTWLDDEYYRESYMLVIYDFSLMLSNNLSVKIAVEKYFSKNILPWWDCEVEKYAVDGKRKNFNVYFVD